MNDRLYLSSGEFYHWDDNRDEWVDGYFSLRVGDFLIIISPDSNTEASFWQGDIDLSSLLDEAQAKHSEGHASKGETLVSKVEKATIVLFKMDDELTEEQYEYVNKVGECGSHVFVTEDELLDYTSRDIVEEVYISKVKIEVKYVPVKLAAQAPRS